MIFQSMSKLLDEEKINIIAIGNAIYEEIKRYSQTINDTLRLTWLRLGNRGMSRA